MVIEEENDAHMTINNETDGSVGSIEEGCEDLREECKNDKDSSNFNDDCNNCNILLPTTVGVAKSPAKKWCKGIRYGRS